MREFLHAVGLHAVGDIDQHKSCGIDPVFADGRQAGAASHRGAHQHRTRIAQLCDDAQQVFDHRVLGVVSVSRPFGIAVASRVERHGAISRSSQMFAGALPGVTRLSAAMLQQHERSFRVAPRVARDREPAGPLPSVHRSWGTGKRASSAHRFSCLLQDPRAFLIAAGKVAGNSLVLQASRNWLNSRKAKPVA